MKIFRLIFFALAFLPIFFGSVSAQERIVLKVGYVPGTGFLEEDRPGHFRGYGYEYMQFLSRYGNWQFEFVPATSWQECGEKLQSGAIDVLPGMPGSYLRLKNVTRTDHVVGRMPMKLVTRGIPAAKNIRLGTIPDNAPVPSLAKVAKDEGFTYELVSYPLFYDMEEAFQNGSIDGYVAPMLEPNKEKNVLSIFDRQSYRLLVRSDRKDLLAELNAAMDQMLMDQPGIRDRLNDKYLRSGGSPLILNRQEREYLAEKKKLVAAVFIKEKPYAYHEGGELKGVIPDVVAQIADDLGIEIELLETKSAAETTQMIKTGKVDFVADAVCDFSWAASLNMVPTQSYLQLDYVTVKRRGVTPDASSRVACDESLLYTHTFIMPRYPEEQLVYANNIRECFRFVSDGRADILFAPRNEVAYLIEETGAYNLEVASESDFSDSLSLGVYNGADNRLWRILNKEVSHLDINKIRSTVNATINSSHHFSPQWLLYHYPLRALGIIVFVALLAAAIFWYRAYLRRRHTAEIRRLAYTDTRYDLPNMSLLEKVAPKYRADMQKESPDMRLFVVVADMGQGIAESFSYGLEILNNRFKETAKQINAADWVLKAAAGNEARRLVCLAKGKSEAEISRLALAAVRQYGYIKTGSARIWLDMHAGICELTDECDFENAAARAEAACFEAKETDSDVKVFDTKLKEKAALARRIADHTEKALADGEFKTRYQPIYDMKTKAVVGAEALIRWQNDELGTLLPKDFVAIFEMNGFIIPTDYFVLETVCRLQKRRIDEGLRLSPVSVNMSHLHITEEDFIDKMKNIAKKYSLPKGSVELEFPESAFGDTAREEYREHAINIMNALRGAGFLIALDNFGTGRASLMLLNAMPLDAMKIDCSMLKDKNDFKKMRDIIGSLIVLSEKFGIKVVCKGIENAGQEQELREVGCGLGQGFVCSDPLEEEDFLAFCETHG